MKEILCIYWSGTGNTETMAELIAQGAKEAGASITVKTVSEASADDISAYDCIVLGCPSMSAEVLEESEMEPFMAAIDGGISGKNIALFGSYGWGDGQWMRDWEDRIKADGANLIGEGLTVNEAPSGAESDKCIAFGKSLA